jgi:serine/threonine protein kinase
VTVNAEDPAQPTLQHPRLEVRRVLGSGGMGVVHAAYDPLLEREVAVKVIRVTGAASGARARILREARAIARISHPNVVHVYSADAFDDQVAIVMELVQGQTLRQWLAEKTRTWQEIVAVFVEAGHGLAAAHDAGLVHRDFKPDNVMVRSDGRVCVLDFGLARALEAQSADGSTVPLTLDTARTLSAETTVTLEASTPVDHASPPGAQSRVTATGALVGTPLYMAPEQHLGAPTDARADQFAFCVALYRALFGQHPFDDTTYATLVKSVVAGAYRTPPMGTAVPGRVVAVIRRGLRTGIEQRFSTIQDVVAALKHRPRRSLARSFVVAALAAAMAIAGVALMLSPPPTPLPTVRGIGAATPRRLTASGDVKWARVSPDGQWLLLSKSDDLVLVDVSGRTPDRLVGRHRMGWCEPSWSYNSRAFAITDTRGLTHLYEVDASPPAAILPIRGCAVFTGVDEIAAYYLPRGEIRFLDMRSNTKRSCQLPGTAAWVFGLDAVPDREDLLITMFDDVAGRQQLWTMTKQCEGARLRATLPFPDDDTLAQTAPEVTARWGPHPDEILTIVPNYSPPGASLVAVPLSAGNSPVPVLTASGLGHFSLSSAGTAYFLQGDKSAHVWLKKRSGELSRLTKGAEGRLLGSLTPAGDGVLILENTGTGRALRVLPLDGGDVVTVGLYDSAELVPSYATMASNGVIAIVATQQGAPVVLLRNARGQVEPLPEAPLGASMASWVGDRLLLNLPGNRNFAVFENGRRRTTDLLADSSVGWAFAALGAPDGETVAFSANRQGAQAIWTVSVATRQETKVAADMWPVAWSGDGAFIYATRTDDFKTRPAAPRPPAVFRIPATGGAPELWAELPEIGIAHGLLVTARGDVIVSYASSFTDVYEVSLPQPASLGRPPD